MRRFIRAALTTGFLAACTNASNAPQADAPTGGVEASGGGDGTGGLSAAGGVQATADALATESAKGGEVVTGGISTAGGTVGAGGMPGSGGMPRTGGVAGTGGQAPTGGTGDTGGTRASGGAIGVGGTHASGGSIGSGGVVATGGITGNRDAGAATADAAIVDTGAADSPADTGTTDGSTTFSCGSNTLPPASVTVGGITYNLNWNDEFNTAALNASHWNSAATWCCGQGTNLSQNAYLSGGCLELEAARATGGGYTSGWIDTQDKYTFTRGYVEIRARMPKGQGMWPALWMDEVSGNPAAEFDIMEMLGNDPTTIYQTNHLWPSGGGAGTQVHQCTFKGPDFSAGFHVLGFQVQATQITWYVDGAQTCTTSQGINTNPVYLMLNTAVGGVGSWPGAPDQSTVFPNYLDIDYVRVYQ